MTNKTMFGFRLDRVSLFLGHTRTEQDFAEALLWPEESSNLLASLESLRDRLVGVTRVGQLKYAPVDDDLGNSGSSETKPFLRIEEMRIGSSRVDFVVRSGKQGSHDLAMAVEPGADVTLEDKASTNPFHVSLYLPNTGTQAILASEVRSRSSAGYQLLKWISVASFERAFEMGKADDNQWWRFGINPIGDAERLEEVLTQGQGLAFQLERNNAPKGGARSTDKVILRRNGLPGDKIQAIKSMVFGWAHLPKPEGYDPAPSGTPVEQLASLVGIHIDAKDFDDGSLSYDDSQGRTQTIRPSNVGDVFIYPISVGQRPTAAEFRGKARDRIIRLLPSLKIPIDI